MAKLFPIELLRSFIISKGFLLRLIALSRINWSRNGKLSKFESPKEWLNHDDSFSQTYSY